MSARRGLAVWLAGGSLLAVAGLAATGGPGTADRAAYEPTALPPVEAIDFEAWNLQVESPEPDGPAVEWVWRNRDALCEVVIEQGSSRKVSRALQAAGWIETAGEVAYTAGLLDGCQVTS